MRRPALVTTPGRYRDRLVMLGAKIDDCVDQARFNPRAVQSATKEVSELLAKVQVLKQLSEGKEE